MAVFLLKNDEVVSDPQFAVWHGKNHITLKTPGGLHNLIWMEPDTKELPEGFATLFCRYLAMTAAAAAAKGEMIDVAYLEAAVYGNLFQKYLTGQGLDGDLLGDRYSRLSITVFSNSHAEVAFKTTTKEASYMSGIVAEDPASVVVDLLKGLLNVAREDGDGEVIVGIERAYREEPKLRPYLVWYNGGEGS